VKGLTFEKLLTEIVTGGKIVPKKESPMETHKFLEERADLLPDEHKRFISPHLYKTGISEKLMETRNTLSKQIKDLI
jgi:nicotinate phosphoribosyltransferase